jgi:hypothetical protein
MNAVISSPNWETDGVSGGMSTGELEVLRGAFHPLICIGSKSDGRSTACADTSECYLVCISSSPRFSYINLSQADSSFSGIMGFRESIEDAVGGKS